MGTGAAHSACLDESGAVLAWRSADPGLHVQEVGGPLAGKRVVSISAGDALHPPEPFRVLHTSVKSADPSARCRLAGAAALYDIPWFTLELQ